jgi:hypothetical protein
MSWSALWGFLKALPTLLQIYKDLKAIAKERGIQQVEELTKEFKNESDPVRRARLLANMFK